jgi:hypothetical protein
LFLTCKSDGSDNMGNESTSHPSGGEQKGRPS